MADVNVIPTAQNLPDGFCPTDYQDQLDAFAAAMRVTLPAGYGQIVIGPGPIGAGDQDKIWFETDAGGHVLAIKSWDTVSSAWERADETPYYFLDSGSANNLAITTGDAISDIADLEGRLLMVNIAATNTSPTTTLAADSTAATAVKKFGATLLQPGDLVADQIAILIFDGTDYQLLNPAPQFNSTVYATSAYTSIATADIDISFVLPTDKTTWDSVRLFAINYLDSQGGAAVTSTVTFKWNCGSLLNTAVTQSASTGAGTSGQSFGLSDDNQNHITTNFMGVVPGAIETESTLTCRATLALTGTYDPGSWMVWGEAIAS